MAKITGIHVSGEVVGSVKAWPSNTTPTNYLLCDGSAVSRTTYADLFAKIGTTHGQGDGSTTFNIPDYRGVHLRGLINIPPVTGSGTAATNNATFTAHGLRTGMRVRMTSGTLSGLATATNYWAIVIDTNTLAFATTQALATAASPTKITISGANSAVIQQWMDPDASSRLAPQTGANTGASVGSHQDDNLGSHSHTGGMDTTQNLIGGSSGAYVHLNTQPLPPTGSTGGNQTTAINSYVNYIIAYK